MPFTRTVEERVVKVFQIRNIKKIRHICKKIAKGLGKEKVVKAALEKNI